ncbi:restriction endonuclease subunit S [Micromonospora sp. WMMD730]|uniref:restriction endonuclease subunit S n=1 Tax=Micromonospora sp. WMMD730 TaxID=3404128 RepID=UPI003B96691F
MRDANDGWQLCTLGEVLQLRTERGVAGDPLLSVLAGRGVVPQHESGRRDISSADKTAYRRVHSGDIVYNTMRMWQGVSARSNLSGIVSPAYTVCRPAKGVDTRFVAHLLRLPRLITEFKNRSQGLVSDTWNLKYSSFKNISILMPPEREQQRVADILDSVDDSIDATERLLAKLTTTTQGALFSMLEQAANSQPPALMRTLGSIGRIRSGSTPSRALYPRYYLNPSLPWVKTLDLNEDIVTSTDEWVTDAAVADYSCPVLSPGTVLIAMYGGWAQIGRTAVLGRTATINQAISAVEVQDPSVDPLYVQLALQIRRHLWKRIAASTRKDPNITRADVLAFEIPVPSLGEQRKIVSASKSAKTGIRAEQIKLAKIRRLKDGLMEDLLTGRVRVPTEGA